MKNATAAKTRTAKDATKYTDMLAQHCDLFGASWSPSFGILGRMSAFDIAHDTEKQMVYALVFTTITSNKNANSYTYHRLYINKNANSYTHHRLYKQNCKYMYMVTDTHKISE